MFWGAFGSEQILSLSPNPKSPPKKCMYRALNPLNLSETYGGAQPWSAADLQLGSEAQSPASEVSECGEFGFLAVGV